MKIIFQEFLDADVLLKKGEDGENKTHKNGDVKINLLKI